MTYSSIFLTISACIAYYYEQRDAALTGLLINVVLLTVMDYYNNKVIQAK